MSSKIIQTLAKPAGLTVFPRHDDPDADCLLTRLLIAEPWRAEIPWPVGFPGGIAHRLDTSTSGAVAVAADPEELMWLRGLFERKRLRKVYRFLAARGVRWDRNTCELPLAHDRRRKSRMVPQRGGATPHRGRWLPARTVLSRVSGSLWEARIRTGVMHQIRVHAAFVGVPLLGDRMYGGGSTPPDAPPGVTFFLHHVGFSGGEVCTAPVPSPQWSRSDDADPSEGPRQ